MIYLITLNPAIDQYIDVNNFEKNITNKSTSKEEIFGGKAINVGKIVNEFLNEYQIITTIDNKNKDFILENTKDLNIKFFNNDYIRTNIKINDNSKITEINETVKDLNEKTKKEINDYLIKKVKEEDYVLFAGSLSEIDTKFIKNLILSLKTKNIILDIPTFTLNDFNDLKPLMIKPNEEEIKKIFNKSIEPKEASKKLNELGIKEVIISLGKDGAYYKDDLKEIKIEPIIGKAINTVGAGDSFVGGYLVGKQKGYSTEEVLKLANTCGASTAFSKNIATKKEIEQLLK